MGTLSCVEWLRWNWLVVQAVRRSPVPAHTQLSYRERVCSTPRPIDSIIGVSGILDHPPSRAMDDGGMTHFTISRLDSPEVCIEFPRPPIRGRRECRVRAAPAVSCAMGRRSAHMSIQGSGGIRHSLRNGFTAYNVLSPENGSFASVALRSCCLQVH